MNTPAVRFAGLNSLRAKGLLATLTLLAYLLVVGLYSAAERTRIFDGLRDIERVSAHEKALALTEAAVSGALVDANEASSAGLQEPASPAELRLYMESCARLFADLQRYEDSYAPLQLTITRSYEALLAAPVRASWIDLREALHRAAQTLEQRRRSLADERETLTAGYHRSYDAVTLRTLLLGGTGLLAFGALAAWFFARLTQDLRGLQAHAQQIVGGSRGVALKVERSDELGELMQAVNHMAVDLDEREKRIALDSDSRSQQDKLLAVGALAAGVAHEVNNPLAVISGLAQELKGGAASPGELQASASQILLQVQRASLAARQLAEVAAPQPAELDWVDINRLLRQAAQLTGYDRRYRRFVFELQLDPALPAVRTSAGAVQQVLMQLLALVCSAVAARDSGPVLVRLITLPDNNGVMLQLIFPHALDFTRSDAQRSLLLCRAIVEPLRGRLAFGQAEGALQRIKLNLPADQVDEDG